MTVVCSGLSSRMCVGQTSSENGKKCLPLWQRAGTLLPIIEAVVSLSSELSPLIQPTERIDDF